MGEIENIRARYAAREQHSDRYSFARSDVLYGTQFSERALMKAMLDAGFDDFGSVSVLEVGCGGGGNLLRFLRWGFQPENLVANELLEDRCDAARKVLPAAVTLHPGDIRTIDFDRKFDIVYQSTVLSSVLDARVQQEVADSMWDLVADGGMVLSYDFVVGNPSNPDVQGVPVRRIAELFPHGPLRHWKTTLAPPIARRIGRSPALYGLLHAFPPLRTHAVCTVKRVAAGTATKAEHGSD